MSHARRLATGLSLAAASALAVSTLSPDISASQEAQTAQATRAAQVLQAAQPPPVLHDGVAAATAAGSCWEIKQNNPASTDGTYWLLTPAMDAPGQFYCDMTTDGGGWVLIGKGREGWSQRHGGTGTQSALQVAGLSPMSGATTQMPADTVDALLNGQHPDSLADGIRLKRATTASGTPWQEARFNTNKMDRWVWTFGAEHQVAWYSFNGVRGTGGQTADFGPDKAYRHINASESQAQGYTIGFAYGSSVTGTNAADTYLWSASNGLGAARPYTEVYLRPHVLSSDVGFTRTADSGTPAKTNVPVAASFALNSPWGVTGAVSPKREGDVEAQAFVQSGNTMYVGGNFTSVQRAAHSTGADKVAQSFLAAFDATTGELVRTFMPVLNGSVMSLAVLPNGSVVAGGMFSQANGVPATAIVALNPATGATDTSWKLTIENRLTGGVLRVSALSVEGGWLYLGGAFTHLSGGSAPNTNVYAKGAARVSLANGTPGSNWNPEFNGTVVALDAANDGGRLYAAGYFTTSGTAAAFKAAAVQTTAGAPLATPAWSPVWSNTKDYQQSIRQVGERVWVGGSEHSLFSYSTSTFERLSGNIGKSSGDFQAIAPSITGIVYGGSHGHDWNYSNAFTWPGVGTAWTEADSFEWVGAWDAATGYIIPAFTPSMKFRLGQGIWAITVDSNGTMWAGGDMTTVATTTRAGQWVGGFARFPQVDAKAPTTPGNVTKASDSDTTVSLSWNASVDGGGPVSYQVLRNDRVVAVTTATSATVPKGGENRFFVRAVDAAGNLSASSPVITAAGDGGQPVDTVVVPAKSAWKWSYSTTAPPPAWKSRGFDAAGWQAGPAPLGFGSTGLGTNIDVPPPTSTRPLAAYFIRQFTVDSLADVRKLSLATVADDGVVIYVNGTEVGRSNMPEGDVTFNSYASSAVNTTTARANPVELVVPTSLLVQGTNVIAAETHVNYRATKDLGFDLEATLSSGGTAQNQAPVAKFTAQPTGLDLALDATSSSDADGAVVHYAWDFGDGTTAQGATATHTYKAANTYTVSLVVTDNEGATSTASEPVTVARPAGPVDVAVIPTKSSWSWRYESGAPDSAWKNRGFDASTWKVGAGLLGFGSPAVSTNIDVPPPTSNRPLAGYFISQFNVASAANVGKLVLNTVADDGVVVYVNGTEVVRSNMPTGTVTHGSYALTAVRTSVAAANPVVVNVPVSLLVDGINTVAAETHLNYRATADAGFDLSAVATLLG